MIFWKLFKSGGGAKCFGPFCRCCYFIPFYPKIAPNFFPYVSKGHMINQVHKGIIIKIIKMRKVTKPIVNRDENEMHDYVIIPGGGAEIVRGHCCIAGGAG